jgi:hypothetical protein
MEKDEDIINKSSNSKNAKEIQMLEEDKIANENDENENGIGENEDKNLNTSCLNENGNEIIQQEKNDILLNKSDFINQKTYPKKKSFCQTRYIKRIGIIFIFIPSYLYTAIYIRINSLHLIPVKAGFIQGAIFSIFIPISFFISSIVNFNKNKKYIGKEKEVLNFEIENNVKSNLSEYMNKKYYEVYYQYITKFYFLTAFFSVLYFLSIFFFLSRYQLYPALFWPIIFLFYFNYCNYFQNIQ